MSYAIATKPRLRAADSRWLILAVVAHALILAIPIKRVTEAVQLAPAELLVRLVMPAPRAKVAPPSTEALEAAPAEPLEIDEVVPTAQPRSIPAPKPTTEAKPVTPEVDHSPLIPITPPVTTARLIDQRDSVAETVPLPNDSTTAPRRLGTPEDYEMPSNWQRHAGAEALAPFDNTFNGKTVPENVEVVDSWKAADGSHNVVVETPAGLRMCGRARAHDPLNPLVESVMMWKVCGGDGRRPFDFKPRKPLDRDFIIPMAKDATDP